MQSDSERLTEETLSGSSRDSWLRSVLTGLPLQMVALALVSRIALFLLAWQAGRMVPPLEDLGSPRILNVWGNWDTWHYVTIALDGYDRSAEGVNSAFFPVLPMLLSAVETVFGASLVPSDYRWVAVLISLAFFLGATYALSVLFLRMASPAVATLGVVLFIVSPFSFFFNAGYTDSILVFLVAMTFLAAQDKRWMMAALLVAVATATRVTGVFLIPVLLLMAWQARVPLRKLAGIALISPVGLLAYMAWQWIELGSPIRFYTVQIHWGDFYSRTGQYVEGFLMNPWRWTVDNTYGPVLLMNVGMCALCFAMLWPMYRRFGLAFTAFNALIVAQSSFFIVSQGRYLLVAIGVYVTLAAILQDRLTLPGLKYAVITIFVMSMTMLGLMFANGQWVV